MMTDCIWRKASCRLRDPRNPAHEHPHMSHVNGTAQPDRSLLWFDKLTFEPYDKMYTARYRSIAQYHVEQQNAVKTRNFAQPLPQV